MQGEIHAYTEEVLCSEVYKLIANETRPVFINKIFDKIDQLAKWEKHAK